MMGKERPDIIVIVGPTASGKTKLGAMLAHELGGEIISADSRQVYRGMDIGTGKDLDEYLVDGRRVPYHMIDVVDPSHEFSVFEFRKRFFPIFEEMRNRGALPIMVGGTGLYIESVLAGYRMVEVPFDESLRRELEHLDMPSLVARLKSLNVRLHNTTDIKDRERVIRAIEIAQYSAEVRKDDERVPVVRPLVVGVRWDRTTLRRRITERLARRLEGGLIEEVERLHASGLGWDKLHFFGLEYRYVALYLQGKLNRNDMFQKLNSAIHRFAKRQETWFRRMERRGIAIRWIEGDDYAKLREIVAGELSLRNR